jgi:hypothetical protein
MAYITEKLKALSEKSLSSRRETQVIAVSFKDGNDQLGHNSNIDQKLQAGNSELENKLSRGSLAWLGRQTHNLESQRGKRPTPRSRGLESRPRHHFLPYFSNFFIDATSLGKFLINLFFFRFSFTIHKTSASCLSMSCRIYSKPSLGIAYVTTLKE